MNKIKLFAFPYAGGSAMVYNTWKKYLDPQIELVPVELPGRGRRMDEALSKDVAEIVDDAFQFLKRYIGHAPYVLFGHSLGSTIAYQLAQKIRKNSLPPPLHIFFSGQSAPHAKDRPKKYHLMNDDDFRKEVLELGGTPREFFDHPELLDLFLPLLKNDFKIAEADRFEGEIEPLDENITIFLGKDDDQTPEECDGWKKHTRSCCTIHYFEGGHFFILDHSAQIVQLMNDTVRSVGAAQPLERKANEAQCS